MSPEILLDFGEKCGFSVIKEVLNSSFCLFPFCFNSLSFWPCMHIFCAESYIHHRVSPVSLQGRWTTETATAAFQQQTLQECKQQTVSKTAELVRTVKTTQWAEFKPSRALLWLCKTNIWKRNVNKKQFSLGTVQMHRVTCSVWSIVKSLCWSY